MRGEERRGEERRGEERRVGHLQTDINKEQSRGERMERRMETERGERCKATI
jgi:hypothetical protein